MSSTNKSPYVAAGFGRQFLWLDLANTLEWNGFGQLTDHLQDPSWVQKMIRHWKLAAAAPQPVPLQQIVELRSLLRLLSEKLTAGKSLNEKDLGALNVYLNVPAHVQLIQRQNGVRAELVPDEPGWPWILSRFAASFAETLSLGRLERLKFCPNEGCKWLFFDQTKGNTRIWCNDRTCGNRDRVRRAREKKKPPRRRLKK
jgi:predicted RNA-binding Zn ribbon-like protein